MRTYTFTAPATGAGVPFNVVGNFVRYYSNSAGAANPSLVIKTDHGDSFELAPNEKIKVTRQFKSLLVYNRDLVADISGKLIIGEGDFSANTFSGSVAVTSMPTPLNQAVADDATTLGGATVLPVVARLSGYNGSWFPVGVQNGTVDGAGIVYSLNTQSRLNLFNGATWDRARTPNVFKYAGANAPAAGQINIWTPASGKKFRLMGYNIDVDGAVTAAVASNALLQFQDGATALSFAHYLYMPAAINGFPNRFSVDLGNGYLSLAANNILGLYLPIAFASGAISITVRGTEE